GVPSPGPAETFRFALLLPGGEPAVNVTLTVQLAVGVSVVVPPTVSQGVPVMPSVTAKLPALAPVTVKVTPAEVAFPLLVTVNVNGNDVTVFVTLPKLWLVGLVTSLAIVPVPEREAEALPPGLAATASVVFLLPPELGSNTTSTLQLVPAASVTVPLGR